MTAYLNPNIFKSLYRMTTIVVHSCSESESTEATKKSKNIVEAQITAIALGCIYNYFNYNSQISFTNLVKLILIRPTINSFFLKILENGVNAIQFGPIITKEIHSHPDFSIGYNKGLTFTEAQLLKLHEKYENNGTIEKVQKNSAFISSLCYAAFSLYFPSHNSSNSIPIRFVASYCEGLIASKLSFKYRSLLPGILHHSLSSLLFTTLLPRKDLYNKVLYTTITATLIYDLAFNWKVFNPILKKFHSETPPVAA